MRQGYPTTRAIFPWVILPMRTVAKPAVFENGGYTLRFSGKLFNFMSLTFACCISMLWSFTLCAIASKGRIKHDPLDRVTHNRPG